ncbi:MAG: hypothetical protein K6E96_06235 [Bacteroidales bacterium]|nr:hypothetical protein [Bacteroidales bacterium]
MKKTVLLLAAVVAMAMSANAQWFDFKNNVHRYELGLNLGLTGINTGFEQFGMGASVSAWGVYLDFTSAGPMYKYDNHVASMNDPENLRLKPDSTTTTINLGYQIPVLPWLRIMPLVGFNITTSGHTDMATHNAEVNGDGDYVNVELYHDYIREYRWSYFNFGGGIVISPIKWVSIYGIYTTRAIYGGITFNFSALATLAEE